MILAAMPRPGEDPFFIMAAKGLLIVAAVVAPGMDPGGVGDPVDGGGGEAVVSVREGGGAMAAPPEVAEERQIRLVMVVVTRFFDFSIFRFRKNFTSFFIQKEFLKIDRG